MSKSLSSEPSMDDILAAIRQSVNGAPAGEPAAALPKATPAIVTEPLPAVSAPPDAQPETAEQRLQALLTRVEQDASLTLSARGPTLDDIVRATLRPLLATWIERHLPGLVAMEVRQALEKLVQSALPVAKP